MKKTRLCFKDNCFNVSVAETMWQRMRGLMGVKDMAENEGMLFIFGREARRSFWMAGVHIPLDIIWLNGEMKIVEMTKECQPCKKIFCPAITAGKRSRYVLEVNAGVADILKLKVGDKAEIMTF